MPDVYRRAVQHLCMAVDGTKSANPTAVKRMHEIFDIQMRMQFRTAESKLDSRDEPEQVRTWLATQIVGILGEIIADRFLAKHILPGIRQHYAPLGPVKMLSSRQVHTNEIGGYSSLADFYIGIFSRGNPHRFLTGEFLMIAEVEVKTNDGIHGAKKQFAQRDLDYWGKGGLIVQQTKDDRLSWKPRPIAPHHQWIVNANPSFARKGSLHSGFQCFYFGMPKPELFDWTQRIIQGAFPHLPAPRRD